jgi:hypothetical protein
MSCHTHMRVKVLEDALELLLSQCLATVLAGKVLQSFE